MLDVINDALPFFGLIFLGFAFGRFKAIPENSLTWMNFFIIYVALPDLFYRIVAKTPLDELKQSLLCDRDDPDHVQCICTVVYDRVRVGGAGI